MELFLAQQVYHYDGSNTLGIFSTKQIAKIACDTHKAALTRIPTDAVYEITKLILDVPYIE